MVVDCLANHLVLHTAAVAAAAAVAAERKRLSVVLHSGTQSAAGSLPIKAHSFAAP
jgi:hypothetical protein